MDSLVIYKDFYRRGFKYYDKIGADTSGRGYQEKEKKKNHSQGNRKQAANDSRVDYFYETPSDLANYKLNA